MESLFSPKAFRKNNSSIVPSDGNQSSARPAEDPGRMCPDRGSHRTDAGLLRQPDIKRIKGALWQPNCFVRCHLHPRYRFDGGRTLHTRMFGVRLFHRPGPKRRVGRPSYPSTRRTAMLPWLQGVPLSPSGWPSIDHTGRCQTPEFSSSCL